MERLTIKTEKGAALKMASTYPSEDAARNDLMQRYRIAVDHLADYEDTGLTPVEISELKGLWKVVCELYGINTVGLSTNNPLTLDELREIYDGEQGSIWIKFGVVVMPAILDIYDGELMAIWSALGKDDALTEKNYRKTWFAYRRRPEEGTD